MTSQPTKKKTYDRYILTGLFILLAIPVGFVVSIFWDFRDQTATVSEICTDDGNVKELILEEVETYLEKRFSKKVEIKHFNAVGDSQYRMTAYIGEGQVRIAYGVSFYTCKDRNNLGYKMIK